MKKLLIRADDLGWTEAINYGIEKTVRHGIIRSVGVMPNMKAAEHGLNLLKGTGDRKSTRLNSSHRCTSRMPSSA